MFLVALFLRTSNNKKKKKKTDLSWKLRLQTCKSGVKSCRGRDSCCEQDFLQEEEEEAEGVEEEEEDRRRGGT